MNLQYSLRFPAALRSQSGLLGERFTFGMKQAWFTEILYPIIQPFGPRAKDQLSGGEPGKMHNHKIHKYDISLK